MGEVVYAINTAPVFLMEVLHTGHLAKLAVTSFAHAVHMAACRHGLQMMLMACSMQITQARLSSHGGDGAGHGAGVAVGAGHGDGGTH